MANKRTKPGSPERAEIAEKVIKAMDSGMSCFKACQQAVTKKVAGGFDGRA